MVAKLIKATPDGINAPILNTRCRSVPHTKIVANSAGSSMVTKRIITPRAIGLGTAKVTAQITAIAAINAVRDRMLKRGKSAIDIAFAEEVIG
ncbi:hypothetical protein SH528x_001938 [Novipirellula sp. SH528]|uniref:hypothetical protein n=1 Tax=Novipirellula sp. SH528 TaxID=3454466 RepID=UPI003FA10597